MSNMNYCPLMFSKPEISNYRCVEYDCAWWIKEGYSGRCAVVRLAVNLDNLADATPGAVEMSKLDNDWCKRGIQNIPRADFDRLEKGYCPDCNVKLGMHGASQNQCPICHWSWPESNGVYHYAVSSVAGDEEWFYRTYQGNHLLEQSSAGSVREAEEIARGRIEQLNKIDLGTAFTAMNRRMNYGQ